MGKVKKMFLKKKIKCVTLRVAKYVFKEQTF